MNHEGPMRVMLSPLSESCNHWVIFHVRAIWLSHCPMNYNGQFITHQNVLTIINYYNGSSRTNKFFFQTNKYFSIVQFCIPYHWKPQLIFTKSEISNYIISIFFTVFHQNPSIWLKHLSNSIYIHNTGVNIYGVCISY